MSVINTYFSKSESIKSNPWNWYNLKYGIELLRTIVLTPWRHFTGFENWHLPYSLKKSTFKELWNLEGSYLSEVCSHRFRQGTDVNIWLMIYWQYVENNFHPRNPRIGTHFSLTCDMEKNKRLFTTQIKKNTKLLCINDEFDNDDAFKKADFVIEQFFTRIFPNKCSFEK